MKMKLTVSDEVLAILRNATYRGANPLLPFLETANPFNPKVKDRKFLRELDAQVGNLFDVFDGVKQAQDDFCAIGDALHQARILIDKVKSTIQIDSNDDFIRSLTSRLEDLLMIVVHCSNQSELSGMLIPMLFYLKTWAKGPLLETAQKMLRSILIPTAADDLSPEGGYVKSELHGQAGWFSSNWETIVKGDFGHRLAGAINLLILVGLCPENVTNKFGDEVYKALHVSAMRKKSSSIFEYLFRTVDWVVDTVIPAFVTGDMSLLLLSSDYGEIDQMYRNALDMVHLNITGQMEKVKEKYDVSDEAELIVYLTKVSAALLTVKANAKGDGPIQKEMLARLIKLDKLQGDIQAYWHSKGLRVKPYAVLIRGASSVGKSTLSGICVHAISAANGFPEGKEYCVTLNGSDKYQSEYRSCVIATIFDDFGNTKPEHADGNPLFVLIQFINNMHCAALSPEAEKKGKNDIRTKIVIVTTNTTDLHSGIFSVNPASIMRRFDLVIDPELKPGCASPDGGLHPKFAGTTQPDAWNIQLSKVRIIRSKNQDMADKWVLDPILRTDVVGLIDYLGDTTPGYFKIQEAIVESSSDMHLKPHCTKHPLFTTPCPKCMKVEREKRAESIARENAAIDVDDEVFYMATNALTNNMEDVEALKQGTDLEEAIEQMPEPTDRWEPIDPEAGPVEELLNPLAPVDEFLHEFLTPDMLKDQTTLDAQTPEDDEEPLDFFARMHFICGQTDACLKDLAKTVIKTVEQHPVATALGSIAAAALAMVSIFNLMQPKRIEPEGAILTRIQEASKTPETFVERDGKYQKVYSIQGPRPGASVSTTLTQLESRIDSNLYVVIFQKWDQSLGEAVGPRTWGNAVPVGKGQWLITGHQVDLDEDTMATFQFHPNIGAKRFTVILNKANAYSIPKVDAIVATLPGGGDNVDFSKYMFDDAAAASYEKGAPLLVYHAHLSQIDPKNESYVEPSKYKLVSSVNKIERRRVRNVGTHDLLMYDGPNHDGMCGSMVFLGGKNPVFIGIHTAGDKDAKECGVTLITKDMIQRDAEHIQILESNDFPAKIMGKEVPVSTHVHRFAPVMNVEDNDRAFEAVGQHSLPTAKFRTSIGKSPLAGHMEDVMDYEPTHGSPPLKGARVSRARHFDETTKTRKPVNPKYLKVAVRDLKRKLKRLTAKQAFRDHVHTMNLKDACSGVDGVKGFDCTNPLTAMGFPFTGPKWQRLMQSGLEKELGIETFKYITRVVDGDKVSYTYELKFDKELFDVEGQLEELLHWFVEEGKRANVVFKANLKDEALKFKKIEANHIRVFAGAPLHMVLLARMLTLPLLNLMTMFPAEFETAVGVDATGRDWKKIRAILEKFGELVGDGDFKTYDTNMDPNFSEAGWGVTKFLLEQCGFGEDCLKAFDGLATECIYPFYESNGFIYKALGSNPSGHPLTVIINSLANSIYMRYAYYAMHDVSELDVIPEFAEMVSLITYGDDNAYNVHPDEKLFNMQSVCAELEKIGVVYTGADKEKPKTPFKKLCEISFLKRTFHVHPVLQEPVGALEKSSIYKSLYLMRYEKSRKESDAEICAMNLANALRELYYHSRTDYLEHFPLFLEIASRAVDSQGHRVLSHYKPPSEKQIIADFQATTSRYEEALEKIELSPEAGNADLQSDDDDHNEALYGRFLQISHFNGCLHRNRVPAFDWIRDDYVKAKHAFWVKTSLMRLLFHECYPCPAEYERSPRGLMIVMPTIFSAMDVKFRRFMAEEFPMTLGAVLAQDFRLCGKIDVLEHELSVRILQIRAKKDMLKKAIQAIEYAHEASQNVWDRGQRAGWELLGDMPHTRNVVKVMNLLPRMKYGAWNSVSHRFEMNIDGLPPEVCELVSGYRLVAKVHHSVFEDGQGKDILVTHTIRPINDEMYWSLIATFTSTLRSMRWMPCTVEPNCVWDSERSRAIWFPNRALRGYGVDPFPNYAAPGAW